MTRLTQALLATALLAGVMAASATAGAAVEPTPSQVIDDFDDLDASDWTFFGGNEAGGGGGAESDRPAAGAGYLSTGWGGQGTASAFYGGAVRNFDDAAQPAPGEDAWINLWVLNQSDASAESYTLEVTLREDLDANGWTDGAEDSLRLDTPMNAAAFDDQWRLVSAPLDSLIDLGTGGNGRFDGRLDEIVIVVSNVVGEPGATVELDIDQIAFTSGGPAGDDPVDPPSMSPSVVVVDFEGEVAPGTPCAPDQPPVGFCTFAGAGSSVSVAGEASPPAPERPDAPDGNTVLAMEADSTSFAGFINGFIQDGATDWTPQDWSTREGVRLWFHGTGSGAEMFIDLLDNRNPESSTDDAERWTVSFTDDTAGWVELEFPFSDFSRKEIGNGAPNDGLGLFEIHGWALGVLGSDGPRTFYLDELALYGEAAPPELAVQFATNINRVEEGTTGALTVKLNRPIGPGDPEQVEVRVRSERSYAQAGTEFTPVDETLTFVAGGPSEIDVPIETFDDTKFEGDEQVIVRIVDPVGAERGSLFQASVLIVDNDPFDADLIGDFETGGWLWEAGDGAGFEVIETRSDEPGARPGQDAVERVAQLELPIAVDVLAPRRLCRADYAKVRIAILSSAEFDATTIDHRTVRLGDAPEAHRSIHTGRPFRSEGDANGDGLDDLLMSFRWGKTGLDCSVEGIPLTGETFDGRRITAGGSQAQIVRDFPLGQDWSDTESIDLWYEGTGTGETVSVVLKDNRADDPGPEGWELVWSDEFDGPSGTVPDPANWSYEIGDVTPDGKNGWGNEELQYYTDDPDNAATDGDGNLVITLNEADPGRECYYGPCEFESARLITQHKAEFAYGRIESRVKVPDGGDGLWPAFWSLGTDITYNPWPGSGEIDVMEYVSRLPDEIFGTIHGPGYSGGGSFGGIYDEFGERVDERFHTFTVEWEPEKITWFINGIQYHQATPADVAPNEWVFEKPFFLLLNFAIGGNFGGQVDPDNTYPQEFLVDYVRVYQGPDTAERFEASFVDDQPGWRQISIPVSDFVRGDSQPAGAPDDGLGLDEVWGVGLAFPEGSSAPVRFDMVERVPVPPPASVTVTSTADEGDGSLRAALATVADGGVIDVDPSLAGSTIELSSGELAIERSVSIDASAAPGLTLSGGGSSRVVSTAPGTQVVMTDLVIADGVAAPQGGGILNRGELRLERVTVRDNTEVSEGPANFEFGGGGIYNATDARLELVDSQVIDNATLNQPGGGIYGFFGSTLVIEGSTISGNVAADVAGGIRSLGDVSMVNSTVSANTSTAWHGGGIFHTDGSLDVSYSTFAENLSPAGTASAIVVATFGAPAQATLTGNILAGVPGSPACAREGGDGATISSGGSNLISDGSCEPGADDRSDTDAQLGPLADNGGPTLTHLPATGSPAIDGAGTGCPATDQRGVGRPQGPACDSGAIEVE